MSDTVTSQAVSIDDFTSVQDYINTLTMPDVVGILKTSNRPDLFCLALLCYKEADDSDISWHKVSRFLKKSELFLMEHEYNLLECKLRCVMSSRGYVRERPEVLRACSTFLITRKVSPVKETVVKSIKR